MTASASTQHQDLEIDLVAPEPICQDWVQAAGYQTWKEKKDLLLKALHVRAYARENGSSRLHFYTSDSSLEPCYILDLMALSAVKRQITTKATDAHVVYILKFGAGNRIRTRLQRVKIFAHVLRFKQDSAATWDKIFLEIPASKRRRNRVKSKIKSFLHTTTFHRFHREKGSRPRNSTETRILGIVMEPDEDSPLHSPGHKSAVTLEVDGLQVGAEHSAHQHALAELHEGVVAQKPTTVPTKPFMSSFYDDIGNGGPEIQSCVVNVDSQKNDVETYEVSFDVDPIEEGSESLSSDEAEEQLLRLETYSISSVTQPTSPTAAGPPFTSLERLCNTSEEVRSATWPTIEEFNILLEFEDLMKLKSMEANDWVCKLNKNNMQLYTKKLPSTVSSATLVTGLFRQINAPPEVIYILIRNAKDRLSWDENIKQCDIIEVDDLGREIEYCVCKSPIGFSNREFLKYRICQAAYQEYPYMMLMRSCEREQCPVGRGNVRAESVINGYVIRPDSDPWKTRLQIAANTDVKGLIPTWAVDALAAKLPPRWVSTLESAAKKYMKKNNIESVADLSNIF